MTHRILVRGAAFQNKGAEAMIRCVQQGILSQLPEVQGLLNAGPGVDWSAEVLRGLRPRVGIDYANRACRGFATVAAAVGHNIPDRQRRRLISRLTGAYLAIDAVIDISGYSTGDPWIRETCNGWGPHVRTGISRYLLTDTSFFQAEHVPSVYLPQCWGPFRKQRSIEHADQILHSARLVYARDSVSLQWLSTLPSFTRDTVKLGSDIAFTFEGASRETGRALLREIGMRFEGAPLVGLVPNMRVYERVAGEGRDNLYVQQLIEVARHFVDRLGCQVAVMPHEIKTTPSSIPDDRYLCRIISEEVANTDAIGAAVGEYTSEELKAMIGETQLLVSSRFHSIVAAMSLRIPVVSVAWAHKYRELMGGVGLGEYVVEHDALADHSLVDLCAQAWSRRDGLVAALEENLPFHERSARMVLDDTVALLRDCLRLP